MPLLTIDEMLARIDAVTVDDVREVARDFYDSDRWSTVCIGPGPEAFRAVTGGFEWHEG
jgi:predicted Zn-dependent peptidase